MREGTNAPNQCGNCKCWKAFSDEDWENHLRKYYDRWGWERPKTRYDFGFCDKIPEGIEYDEEGHTYDGYSFADECYDEELHCFEPIESEEKHGKSA